MAAAEAVLRLRSKHCHDLIPYPWYYLHAKFQLSSLSSWEIMCKSQSVQILLKFGTDMSFGSSKLQEKFQLNSSIKTSVMTDFVFCLVMKKIKNGPNSKKTPRLLDPMPPVGIIGVPSTHQHRPFLCPPPSPLLWILSDCEWITLI